MPKSSKFERDMQKMLDLQGKIDDLQKQLDRLASNSKTLNPNAIKPNDIVINPKTYLDAIVVDVYAQRSSFKYDEPICCVGRLMVPGIENEFDVRALTLVHRG